MYSIYIFIPFSFTTPSPQIARSSLYRKYFANNILLLTHPLTLSLTALTHVSDAVSPSDPPYTSTCTAFAAVRVFLTQSSLPSIQNTRRRPRSTHHPLPTKESHLCFSAITRPRDF